MYSDPPQTSYFWDTAKLLMAGIIGFCGAYLMDFLRKRDTRANPVADYLKLTATTLEGMANSFKANSIPYNDGHVLEALVPAFRTQLKDFIDDHMVTALEHLVELQKGARDLDGLIELAGAGYNPQAAKKEIDAWVNDAMRLAGDLRGKAGILSTGK